MVITYYSSLFMTDCDFPLIREMQKNGHGVQYLIQIVKGKQCGGLFDLRKYDLSPGIYPALSFEEIKLYSGFIDLSNTYIVFRTSNLKNIKNWIVYINLIKQIKIFKPSVVHIGGALGVSEAFLYRFMNKMVMTVHDPFMHSGEYTTLSEIKRFLSFKACRKLIILNESQREEFTKHYKIHESKIVTSRLGVYTPLNYLSNLQCSNNNRSYDYILFFGHISPYKGIDVLCKAMALIHAANSPIHCVIAGRGNYDFDIEPYKKLGVIHFENKFIDTKELVDLISHSLFVVCPYKDATQSGVVSSAFALAKPVLATNVGGLGESVINNVTGKLVAPNDPNGLAESIIEMLNNRTKLDEYSENIRQMFFEGDKSWAAIASQYLNAYVFQDNK